MGCLTLVSELSPRDTAGGLTDPKLDSGPLGPTCVVLGARPQLLTSVNTPRGAAWAGRTVSLDFVTQISTHRHTHTHRLPTCAHITHVNTPHMETHHAHKHMCTCKCTHVYTYRHTPHMGKGPTREHTCTHTQAPYTCTHHTRAHITHGSTHEHTHMHTPPAHENTIHTHTPHAHTHTPHTCTPHRHARTHHACRGAPVDLLIVRSLP